MIPKIIHFIFGLKESSLGQDLSYLHYLAVVTANKMIKPDIIYFYYEYEPNGYWWENIKKIVELNKVNAPSKVFGNEISSYAHKADVIRLEVLQKIGGIYLDIDVVTLNSFDNLLNYKNVMGIEPSVGLCNAVILAEKQSEFLKKWYNSYTNFSKANWNYHSIQLPLKIAKEMREDVHIEDYYSFFYPFYKDTAYFHLWDAKLNYNEIFKTVLKNIILKIYSQLPNSDIKYVPILHQFKNAKWHYNKMNSSYCMHLWETFWHRKYLNKIKPEEILNNPKPIFNRLIRERLTEDEIKGKL